MLLCFCPILVASYPGDSFKEDPCTWLIVGIHDHTNDEGGDFGNFRPSASGIVEALEHDGQLERLAHSIDRQARRLIGLERVPFSDIELVLKKDVPSWNDSQIRQSRAETLSHLTPLHREFLKMEAENPEVLAFKSIQFGMLDRRITELRYDIESVDATAQILFSGKPTSKVHLVGGLYPHQQEMVANTLSTYRKDQEPVVSLVWETTPLVSDLLSQLSSLVRVHLMTEHNPFANEAQLNFNTDVFRFTGMFSFGSKWTCDDASDVLIAINSALTLFGRDEVTLEVPLTRQFLSESAAQIKGPAQVFQSQLAFQLGKWASRDQSVVPKHYLRAGFKEVLLDIAISLTAEDRFFTAAGNRPSDILDDYTVDQPEFPWSVNYTFTFERRDGKKIKIKFMGPDNIIDYFESNR